MQFPLEPRLGQSPIAQDGLRRDLEDVRGLVDAESAKETQLDYAALAGVGFGERLERVVELHEIRRLWDWLVVMHEQGRPDGVPPAAADRS